MTEKVQAVGAPTKQDLAKLREQQRRDMPEEMKNDPRVNAAAYVPPQNVAQAAPMQALPTANPNSRLRVIQVPDGPRIDMGLPPYATQGIVAKIMGQNPQPMDMLWIKPLMYVRAIDGHAVQHPTDRNQAQDLMNRIGDYGMEWVISAHQQYWPAVSPDVLGDAKKNLPGS
jgi:hypothetical protein